MLYNILLIVQIIVALGIIGLVLVQHGKGADAGAAFGSGASGTIFGSRGASNFLTRSTAILAVIFFLNSMILAKLVSNRTTGSTSITDVITTPKALEGSVVPSDIPAGDEAKGSDLPSGDAVEPSGSVSQPSTPSGKVTENRDMPSSDAPEKSGATTQADMPSGSTANTNAPVETKE